MRTFVSSATFTDIRFQGWFQSGGGEGSLPAFFVGARDLFRPQNKKSRLWTNQDGFMDVYHTLCD